jgi:nitrate/nitrite transporter NarK
MFVLEGVPSIGLGVLLLFMLKDRIADATWLTPSEKARLAHNVERESGNSLGHSIRDAFSLPIVWVLALIEFCVGLGIYAMGFWMPTLVKESGISGLLNIGLFTAIPYIAGLIAMIAVGKASDKHRDRKIFLACAALVGAVSLAAMTALGARYPGQTALSMCILTIATAGILTAYAQFWRLPTLLLQDKAAAAGIAMINSIANLSGFFGPYLIGWLRDATGSPAAGGYMTAGILLIAVVLTTRLPSAVVNR